MKYSEYIPMFSLGYSNLIELLGLLKPPVIIIPAKDILFSEKILRTLLQHSNLNEMLHYSGKIIISFVMNNNQCDIVNKDIRRTILYLYSITGVKEFICSDTYTYNDLDKDYKMIFTKQKLREHFDSLKILANLPKEIQIIPLIKGYNTQSYISCSRYAASLGFKTFAFHCGNYTSSKEGTRELQHITRMMKNHCSNLMLLGFSSPRLFEFFGHIDIFSGMAPYVMGHTYGVIYQTRQNGKGYTQEHYGKELSVNMAIKKNLDFINEYLARSKKQQTLILYQREEAPFVTYLKEPNKGIRTWA